MCHLVGVVFAVCISSISRIFYTCYFWIVSSQHSVGACMPVSMFGGWCSWNRLHTEQLTGCCKFTLVNVLWSQQTLYLLAFAANLFKSMQFSNQFQNYAYSYRVVLFWWVYLWKMNCFGFFPWTAVLIVVDAFFSNTNWIFTSVTWNFMRNAWKSISVFEAYLEMAWNRI